MSVDRAQEPDAGLRRALRSRVSRRFAIPASVGSVLERYALVWILLALVVFFAIWPTTSGTFLTAANVRTVVANEAVILIAAVAALIPFVAGQFDLTIGAVAILSSVVVASLTTSSGLPVVLALPAGVAVGALVGLVSGVIVAYLRASPIVITLGMSTLIAGIVLLYTDGESIVGVPDSMVSFGSGNWLGVPRALWLAVVVVGAVVYLMRYTITGRQLLMIGANPAAATLVGVRTRRLIVLAFVISGALYGVAGATLLAQTGAATPENGLGLTIGALTALFLGSTTIRPGRLNVAGTVVGVFFVAVSVNGLTLAGAEHWVDHVFTGAAVVIAVAISAVFAHRKVS